MVAKRPKAKPHKCIRTTAATRKGRTRCRICGKRMRSEALPRKKLQLAECVGCGATFDARYLGERSARRAICAECRADPKRYNRARQVQQERLSDEQDAKMLARLEKDDNYRKMCPLGAEELILKWQRGEEL